MPLKFALSACLTLYLPIRGDSALYIKYMVTLTLRTIFLEVIAVVYNY